MNHPSHAEFAQRCYKPSSHQHGSWMARHVSRPLALRITWLLQPWPVSAHAVSAAAWATAAAAAIALAQGSIPLTLCGAFLLQLWYLLDHVDGQVARLRGTATLAGVQLDYLMHHFVGLCIPTAIGWGCFAIRGEPIWLLAGMLWSLSVTLAALCDDTRAKAFLQRLKAVDQQFLVQGRAGRRNRFHSLPRGNLRTQLTWLLQKACEQHVTMNLLALLAVSRWLTGDLANVLGAMALLAMSLTALTVAVGRIVRQTRAKAADTEFAAWFEPIEPPQDYAHLHDLSGSHDSFDPPHPSASAQRPFSSIPPVACISNQLRCERS
jgi:hypothetical protein